MAKSSAAKFSAVEVSFTTIPWLTTSQLLLTLLFHHRTSTYTITFTHHHKFRVRVSLVIRDIEQIFSASAVFFLCFIAEYYAAEALGKMNTRVCAFQHLALH